MKEALKAQQSKTKQTTEPPFNSTPNATDINRPIYCLFR